ncbi:gluconokinase [Corynebacterium renale]|uniref:gluconokinase n=1 Tax=Corynebacterium renale TaxID=1724 RepID=UPI000DA35BD3|nr:gluconokinase [Corynebacterium renale]SQG63581.1 gluconokinase [Corynebacterium renale]STD01032.1 gluconokinase [Corynebacterium renale]
MRRHSLHISAKEAVGPYLIALDVGSTASRGGIYDASGRPLSGSKQRRAHAFTTATDGTSTIDADQVVEEIRSIIEDIKSFAAEAGIELSAVAFDTFASSLVCVADGEAITPCVTYADARCAAYVDKLAELAGDEAEYHARTGVRFHTSYLPARILWLAAEHPDVLARTEKMMSLGEYVYFKLAGIEGQAVATAAWAGILNAHTAEYDTPILEAVGANMDWFAPLKFPDEPALHDGLRWFHAIPDGWSSNVGSGAVDGIVGLSAATSGAARLLLDHVPEKIPTGLWCYRVGRHEALLGGALNDVGRAISWLETNLAPVSEKQRTALLAADYEDTIPTVLPFFTGERSTGWRGGTRAEFHGVSASTTPADLWRGTLEGVAVSYARVWEHMLSTGARPKAVVASGSVTATVPGWLQLLADQLDTPVIPLNMKRATLRGTAVIAMEQLIDAPPVPDLPFGKPYAPGNTTAARAVYDKFIHHYG